ncbi:MAG: CtsR family transcriptional regulator [Oscillospiraceae bacterium]|nr:CtsR family transcriptional regulator [Oscillospiraceae bacterium]
MNVTDLIAQAIQEMLDEHDGTARINRNEFAGKIGCVPSQINYVITSRFTPEQGYIVESRRGGGGFIQIIRVEHDSKQLLMHLINSIGDTIDEHSVRIILQNLCSDNIITTKEAKMILSAVTEQVLNELPPIMRGRVRARIFKSVLLNLM